MEFLRGLRRDERPINQLENSWRRAKNMLLNRGFKSQSNEPGFTLNVVSVNGVAATSLSKPICGIIHTGVEYIVFSTDVLSSEIGICTNGVYKTIIDDVILGFNINRPIEGVFKVNFNGQLIIAWWEGTDVSANPVRVMNTATLPFKMNGFKLLNPLDIKLLSLFAPATYPIVDMVGVEAGGTLTSGRYSIILNYEKSDGSTLGWTMPTNGVSVFDDPITNTYENTDGCPAGTATNKAIHIKITNVDTSYSFLRIGYVYESGGSPIVAVYSLRVPIAVTIDTTITGTGLNISVPLTEALVPRVTYPYAKTGTVLSDRLHLMNLRTTSDYDFQKYANNIKIGWVIGDPISLSKSNNRSYKDARIEFYDKSFKSDEVNAFYIGLIGTDMSISNLYHVPGRVGTVAEKAPVTLAEELAIAPNGKVFQLRNTAGRDGTMGYWENSNEVYEVGITDSEIWDNTGKIGDLGGTAVRHHKFPSLDSQTKWGWPLMKQFHQFDNGHPTFRYTATGSPVNGVLNLFPANNYGTFKKSIDPSGYFDEFVQIDDGTTSNNIRYRMQMGRGGLGLSPTRVILNANGSLNSYAEDTGVLSGKPFTVNNCQVVFAEDQTVSVSGILRMSYGYKTAASVTLPSNLIVNITIRRKNGTILVPILNANTGFSSTFRTFSSALANVTQAVSKGDYLDVRVDLQVTGVAAAGDSVLFDQRFAGNNTVIEVQELTYNLTPFIPSVISPTTPEECATATQSLGISLSDIYIPPDIEARIQGFMIFYAKRTNNNISIVGQSALLSATNGSGTAPHNQFAGTAIFDPFKSYDTFRTHDFMMLRTKVPVSPTHVKLDVALSNLLIIDGTFVLLDDLGHRFSNVEQAVAFNAVTPPGFESYPYNFANVNHTPVGKIAQIAKSQYVPANVDVTSSMGFDNTTLEECYAIKLVNPMPTLPVYNELSRTLAGAARVGTHTFYLASIIEYKTDVYNSFKNQEVVSTGKVFLTNGSNSYIVSELYGGDIYRTTHGIKLWNNGASTGKQLDVVYIPVESPMLIPLRYDDGTAPRNYYPKSSVPEDTGILYNGAYGRINDIFAAYPSNPSRPKVNRFPTRIVRSIVSRSEEYVLSWNSFLASDYYEMPKDKGEGWKLDVLNKELMINLKRAFFVARVKDVLQTDLTKVYTGTGDIFDRAPDEIVPTRGGYAGCDSQFGAFVDKHGYFFGDRSQGKLFLFNGQLDEISNEGLSKELFDRLRDGEVIDNPYISKGLCAAMDREWNRLIVGKRGGNDDFTLSYAFDTKTWSSNHDYKPNYLFNNRDTLISVLNNSPFVGRAELYTHNKGANGTFYNGVVYPSYIDIVFRSRHDLADILDAVVWLSDLEDITTGGILRDKTFTHIMIYNDHQCSGIIDVRNINKNWFTREIRNNEETWSFNTFRDIAIAPDVPFLDLDGNLLPNSLNANTSWFNKNIFVGKFGIVRFIYDNTDRNTIYLNDVGVNTIKSAR